MRFSQGDRLGPYEIASAIGEGGMGEVYRARDTRLGRDVAIKALRPDRVDDDRKRRFVREARTIAGLDHPNLLTIFDVGSERDVDYLVTELLRGETLRERLVRVGPMPWREVVHVGEALARGLGAAHARGVVHRDIKPENVFLTEDGRVKILDFGVAHVSAAIGDAVTESETTPGALLGTIPYMAPEQACGEPVDERTDLFSLGVVLYECLAGVSPFRRETLPATFAAIIRGTPKPLEVRDDIAAIIGRLLAKRPEERPASAADVADALARILTTQSGTMAAPPPQTPASIAVLPFADLSPNHDQEYFCDGIAEEILHAMSRLGGVRVAARGSSFQYRGAHDVRVIGRNLDVDHVLEGSVRRAGTRLRITVQLVDVASGRQVWAERYDRETDDVFAVQDEIAARTAATLSIAMTDDARRAWRLRGTQNLAAYEAYLRGRQLASAHTRAGTREAIDAYARSLDLDPAFAAAWCALAEAHTLAFEWYGRASQDAARAGEASARALEHDPQSAEALTARGQALVVADRLADAAVEFGRALEINPTFYGALYAFARVRVAQGRHRDAVELFERGARARTDDYQCLCLAINAYRAIGELATCVDCAGRAVARVERRLEIAPRDERALCLGALALIELGQNAKALAWSQRAREVAADDPSVLYNIACALVRAGDPDQALDTLEQAVGMGFGQRTWFENDSDLDELRATPRFQALLEKLPR
ncbi:MAG: protein kinase [Deltaproteobacteria bacterium]|nr:protein kinase [Deltaproteobacteria bacterium]